MNCKRIQELILTDYSDGQMSPKAKHQIDNHLMQCPECRTLAQKVQQETLLAFENTKLAMPDPFIWRRIQNEIEKGAEPTHARVTTADILANFLGSFKPAVAVAAVIILSLVITPVVNHQLAQRPSYLTYVMDTDNDSGDVASGIEQYFL